MSRAVVVVISVALALLCLLALNDITTGSEPSHSLERAMVAVTAASFGSLFWRRGHS